MGGVAILVGRYNGSDDPHTAVLVNDSSGWAFGPLFQSDIDAGELAQAFLDWLRAGLWMADRGLIFTKPGAHYIVPGPGDGTDPREFTDAGIEALHRHWASVYLDDDGELLEPLACSACGHVHTEEDGAHGPCYQTVGSTYDSGGPFAVPVPCPCTAETWEPANRVGELVKAAL